MTENELIELEAERLAIHAAMRQPDIKPEFLIELLSRLITINEQLIENESPFFNGD
jgi:hypothetical protein